MYGEGDNRLADEPIVNKHIATIAERRDLIEAGLNEGAAGYARRE